MYGASPPATTASAAEGTWNPLRRSGSRSITLPDVLSLRLRTRIEYKHIVICKIIHDYCRKARMEARTSKCYNVVMFKNGYKNKLVGTVTKIVPQRGGNGYPRKAGARFFGLQIRNQRKKLHMVAPGKMIFRRIFHFLRKMLDFESYNVKNSSK